MVVSEIHGMQYGSQTSLKPVHNLVSVFSWEGSNSVKPAVEKRYPGENYCLLPSTNNNERIESCSLNC